MTREQKTNPGTTHGSDGYSPAESEMILRAVAGVGGAVEEVKRDVDKRFDDVMRDVRSLDEKHDRLATDVKDILLAELKKSSDRGALRGTVAGGGITALILAIVPLLEKLLG